MGNGDGQRDQVRDRDYFDSLSSDEIYESVI